MTQTQVIARDSQSQTLSKLRFINAGGMGVGLFLLLWGPIGYLRWADFNIFGLVEGVILVIYGSLLVYPGWRLQRTSSWRIYFTFFIIFSAAFVFSQVIDIMFQYILAAETGKKLFPPIFNSLMIFIALLQGPTLFFLRNPDLFE